MKKLLDGKYALITGGGRGIGRAVALEYARNGANVAITALEENELLEVAGEIKTIGTDCTLLRFDVSDADATVSALSPLIEKETPYAVINNAGFSRDGLMAMMNQEEWSSVLSVSLYGFYNVTRLILRGMLKKRKGRIINMASIVGTLGLPELTAYGASKGAIITLTKCQALEWAGYNINVNAIAPGFCETSYAEDFKKKEELYNFTLERTPQNKWGSSLDAANACLFLSADASKYITGEVLNVDGGWSTW